MCECLSHNRLEWTGDLLGEVGRESAPQQAGVPVKKLEGGGRDSGQGMQCCCL